MENIESIEVVGEVPIQEEPVSSSIQEEPVETPIFLK